MKNSIQRHIGSRLKSFLSGFQGPKSAVGDFLFGDGTVDELPQTKDSNLIEADKEDSPAILLHKAIEAELQAIDLYTKMANQTQDEKLKKLLLEVAGDEKVHVGDFQTYLDEIDPEQAQANEKGAQEVRELVGDAKPTEAQLKAGNYPKGHLKFKGLDISIENPKGSTRSGKGKDGKDWSTVMPCMYGYIRGFYVNEKA